MVRFDLKFFRDLSEHVFKIQTEGVEHPVCVSRVHFISRRTVAIVAHVSSVACHSCESLRAR